MTSLNKNTIRDCYPSVIMDSAVTPPSEVMHLTCHDNTVTVPCQTNQFMTELSLKIIEPLANLNLAIEMLEAAQADKYNDLVIYRGVITRSISRINSMLHDLLPYLHEQQGRTETQPA